MNSTEAFQGGFYWMVQLAGDIAFRWVPATLAVLSGNAPEGVYTSPILTPITQPVTTVDVAYFLQTSGAPVAFEELTTRWETFVALSVLVSLLLAAGIIYCIMRILQIRHNERLRLEASSESVVIKDVSKTQLRWNRVLEQVHSDSEQNLRLAILEADIMLNELLDVFGYRGETMADKMKTVDSAQFKTIDLAWEAHKMRNAVAHKGMMQELTPREAQRVIGLYAQLFREFKFIE